VTLPRRVATVVVLILCLPGCGTITNFREVPAGSLPGNRQVFGGVRRDIDFVSSYTDGTALALLLVAGVIAVDVPLSTAADVLTLPWTVPAARARWCERKRNESRGL